MYSIYVMEFVTTVNFCMNLRLKTKFYTYGRKGLNLSCPLSRPQYLISRAAAQFHICVIFIVWLFMWFHIWVISYLCDFMFAWFIDAIFM